MRKILSLLLAAALLLLALAGCSQAQEEEPLPESIEINFFYNEPCGACHDQINDFYDMFNTQLEDVKDKYPTTCRPTTCSRLPPRTRCTPCWRAWAIPRS